MIYALFNHSKQMSLAIQAGQIASRTPVIGNFLCKLFEYFIRIFFSSHISCRAAIPSDVIFLHGHDIVIGDCVSIGRRCKIFNGVTLGNRDTEANTNDQPTIEDDCVISTGAKILGNVRIGQGSIVGANSVVLRDVPPHSIAVGIPARVMPRDKSKR